MTNPCRFKTRKKRVCDPSAALGGHVHEANSEAAWLGDDGYSE